MDHSLLWYIYIISEKLVHSFSVYKMFFDKNSTIVKKKHTIFVPQIPLFMEYKRGSTC